MNTLRVDAISVLRAPSNWDRLWARALVLTYPHQVLRIRPFEVSNRLPDRIRVWRTIHGVARDELADRLGVDPSTVWRCEAGESRPSYKDRERLEEVLGF